MRIDVPRGFHKTHLADRRPTVMMRKGTPFTKIQVIADSPTIWALVRARKCAHLWEEQLVNVVRGFSISVTRQKKFDRWSAHSSYFCFLSCLLGRSVLWGLSVYLLGLCLVQSFSQHTQDKIAQKFQQQQQLKNVKLWVIPCQLIPWQRSNFLTCTACVQIYSAFSDLRLWARGWTWLIGRRVVLRLSDTIVPIHDCRLWLQCCYIPWHSFDNICWG